jgi:hypothetical protein
MQTWAWSKKRAVRAAYTLARLRFTQRGPLFVYNLPSHEPYRLGGGIGRMLARQLEGRKPMSRKSWWFVTVAAAAVAGIVYAQQFPMLDAVANKVVQKYQSSSCEQLWAKKGQPKSPEEQRVVGMLKNEAAMRAEFLNRVAAPIANKMFECGMIP